VLALNDRFRPPVSPTWTPKQQQDFYDAFQYVSEAFSRVSDGAKLLLSTCKDHAHAYNAAAFEAHAWAGYQEGTFGYVLNLLAKSTQTGTPLESPALTALYWSVQYVTEAWKKHDLFHRRFGDALRELTDEFTRQGVAAARWWEFTGRPLLDPSPDEEIVERFNNLVPLVSQMMYLTAFTTKVLYDAGVLTETALDAEFARHGTSLRHADYGWLARLDRTTAAARYNDMIRTRSGPDMSIVTTMLPMDPKSAGDGDSWLPRAIAAVGQCFLELHRSLNEFCRKYEVVEGDLPFSPRTNRRVLADGCVERRLEHVFLLTLDIIKSTNSEVTNACKDMVRQTFHRFADQGLYFEDTGNDAFVACAEDPAVLWDCAKSIAHEGWNLRRPGDEFGGTRKALAFGTVAVVEKPDGGGHMIRDARVPNVIPLAFGLLEAVDRNVDKESRNFAVAIDGAALPHCQARLNLVGDAIRQVSVAAKHARGICHIAMLRRDAQARLWTEPGA
jgi:hypothetical protein